MASYLKCSIELFYHFLMIKCEISKGIIIIISISFNCRSTGRCIKKKASF